MIVSERRVNPFGGAVAITLSKMDRHEPPASLFKAPQGYQVIRAKRQVRTRLAQDGSWSITPPDYDPNGSSGGFIYPFPTR